MHTILALSFAATQCTFYAEAHGVFLNDEKPIDVIELYALACGFELEIKHCVERWGKFDCTFHEAYIDE